MTKPSITGNRFWSERGKRLNLNSNGFTLAHTGQWSATLNSHLVESSMLLQQAPIVVLLGEPGSGKSFELAQMMARAKASHRDTLYLDLGRYADANHLETAIRRLLSKRTDGSQGTLVFLDSLDECRVNIKRAETVIEDVLTELPAAEICICIACRTTSWPSTLHDALASHWMRVAAKPLVAFEIAPFSEIGVTEYLHTRGVDSHKFFDALDQVNAHGLARGPLGLNFLVSQWHDREDFPASRWTLYERGCSALVRENGERRKEDAQKLPDVRSRISIAGRIAALAMLTNNAYISLKSSFGEMNPTPALEILDHLNIPFRDSSDGWKPSLDEYKAVLDSALFVSVADGRYVFAHRTYAEFLAAHYVDSLRLTTSEVLAAIQLPDGSKRVAPQLRELAAWLGQKDTNLTATVLAAEPELIFQSNVSLSELSNIGGIFDALAAMVKRGDFMPYEYVARSRYAQLQHPKLALKLANMLSDATCEPLLREFAALVSGDTGAVRDLQFACRIVLDNSESYQLRKNLAHAIAASGTPTQKQKLLALIASRPADDPEDELKGVGLQIAIESEKPIRAFLSCLRPKQVRNLTGAYGLSLYNLERRPLLSPDVAPVLKWLGRELAEPDIEYGWSDFLFRLLDACIGLASAEGAHWEMLGRICWTALETHGRLSLQRQSSHIGQAVLLAMSDDYRRHLLKGVLLASSGPAKHVAAQIQFGSGLLERRDARYLVGLYEEFDSTCPRAAVVANLLTWHVLDDNGYVREWLLQRAGPHAVIGDGLLAEVARDHLRTVDLTSQEAADLRATFLRQRQAMAPIPAPKPQKSISLLKSSVARALGKEPSEWTNIVSYLRYDGDFVEFQIDAPHVTNSALWKKLDDCERSELLTVAHRFLHEASPASDDLPADYVDEYDEAGLAALVALYDMQAVEKDEVSRLSLKWIVSIARSPFSEQPEPFRLELLQLALKLRPEEARNRLLFVFRRALAATPPRIVSLLLDDTLCLRADVESLLVGSVGDAAYLALAEKLIAIGSERALTFAADSLKATNDLNGPRHRGCMRILAKLQPKRLLDAAWTKLRERPQLLAEVLGSLNVITASPKLPILTVSPELTEEIYELVEQTYPQVQDEKIGGRMSQRQHVQEVRNSCILALTEMATGSAIEALSRISERHPDKPWIRTMLLRGRARYASESWIPHAPLEAFAALGLSAGRVVRSEHELLQAVLSELEDIKKRISRSSSPPAVYFLWEEKLRRPKYEPRLCDWLTYEMRKGLAQRGAIVNREVQVRSSNPKGVGQRTDIQVEAINLPHDSSGKPIRVIIEVKGCWNRDLLTAPASQLVNDYMQAFDTGAGVYLVLWFLCETWNNDDKRKGDTLRTVEDGTFDTCARLVGEAAASASSETHRVVPFVIDCTY